MIPTTIRIGIIAALPGELKPLVRGWHASELENGTRIWIHKPSASEVWVATCSGMGAEAARRAFAAAEADGPLDMVLSVGWAGALTDDARPGEATSLSVLIDAMTGERFDLKSGRGNSGLITVGRVAGAKEKVRLRAAYPDAVMVDMEAGTVARLAQMRGIPVTCIKGISDGFDAVLPDLNPFISSTGQLRLLPFVAHIAFRPKFWKAIAELNRNSSKAAQAMRDLILKFLEVKNVDKLNRA